MATKPQARNGEYQEILAWLRAIESRLSVGGGDNRPLPIPLIDPTANVKEASELERRHQSELRETDNRWADKIRISEEQCKRELNAMQDKLREADFRRQDELRKQAELYQNNTYNERKAVDAEARRAEADRINALLAAKDQNVALALEKQGAQATAQDKRIAVLEQNQYQGLGAAGQRVEGRQQNQWIIGMVIGLMVVVADLLAAYLTRHP